MYSDHSVYVWDVRDMGKVEKVYSALYHSGCVWGVEVRICVCLCVYTHTMKEDDFKMHWRRRGQPGGRQALIGRTVLQMYPEAGPGSTTSGFITCSSDNTIRQWNSDSPLSQALPCTRNLYSNVGHTQAHTDAHRRTHANR